MSIEAMYPSRRQSRLRNPLYWNSLRRKIRIGAVLMGLCGIGYAVWHLAPAPAEAHDGTTPTATAVVTATPAQAATPVAEQALRKNVRVIPLFEAPAQSAGTL
jgi:hypothetical protein